MVTPWRRGLVAAKKETRKRALPKARSRQSLHPNCAFDVIEVNDQQCNQPNFALGRDATRDRGLRSLDSVADVVATLMVRGGSTLRRTA
jgi:hypothetical protein